MKTIVKFLAHLFRSIAPLQRECGMLCILCLFLITSFLNGCKPKSTEPDRPPVPQVKTVTQNAAIGTAVVLDGSGSSDPANKALTYNWTIKSKPTDSKATLTNPTSVTVSFMPDKPGTYVLVLTVTDSNNQSSSVDVTVTVAIPGKAPVANAGPSGVVTVGRRVALDGSKSADPDNDPLTYKWAIKTKPDGSKATILNDTKAVTEFTADLLGTYIFTLTVSDGNWPAVTAEASITAVVPSTREISGNWTAADGTGGGNDYTPRNHFYTFDVAANNQPVSLTLTSSDINVGFYVYDPNGKELDSYGSGFGRNQTEDVIVNAGKYTVMVASGKRYDIGAYTLKGRGMSSDFARIPALREKATDVSFGPQGGGGGDFTSRNHYYTFEVTADNSFTDINVQSAETTLWLQLIAPSGDEVRYSYIGTPKYLLEKLNKGTYGLWVGSGKRDAIGKYTLDIFGQVKNLKQYVFESSVLSDEYRGKNATNTYTLNVTDDNTILDVSLRSPDVTGEFWIYDPTGSEIGYSYGGNYQYLIRNTRKGQYKIVVKPTNNTSGIGKYTLSVYGKFTDLKKQ